MPASDRLCPGITADDIEPGPPGALYGVEMPAAIGFYIRLVHGPGLNRRIAIDGRHMGGKQGNFTAVEIGRHSAVVNKFNRSQSIGIHEPHHTCAPDRGYPGPTKPSIGGGCDVTRGMNIHLFGRDNCPTTFGLDARAWPPCWTETSAPCRCNGEIAPNLFLAVTGPIFTGSNRTSYRASRVIVYSIKRHLTGIAGPGPDRVSGAAWRASLRRRVRQPGLPDRRQRGASAVGPVDAYTFPGPLARKIHEKLPPNSNNVL